MDSGRALAQQPHKQRAKHRANGQQRYDNAVAQFPLKKGMQRDTHDDRDGHQRQEERPGVDKEKQRVRAVNQKGDRSYQPAFLP